MFLNIEKIIESSAGFTLTMISVSGLLCLNNIITKNEYNMQLYSKSYFSKSILNISLIGMGTTGVLMIYRGVNKI